MLILEVNLHLVPDDCAPPLPTVVNPHLLHCNTVVTTVAVMKPQPSRAGSLSQRREQILHLRCGDRSVLVDKQRFTFNKT